MRALSRAQRDDRIELDAAQKIPQSARGKLGNRLILGEFGKVATSALEKCALFGGKREAALLGHFAVVKQHSARR